MQSNVRNLKYAVNLLNVTFHVGDKIVRGLDFPHVQRGSQCASQSPSDTSNHMVERRRILGTGNRSAILLLVEVFDSAMDSKVHRLIEPFDVSRSMWPLMLFNSDLAGMRDGHAVFPYLGNL